MFRSRSRSSGFSRFTTAGRPSTSGLITAGRPSTTRPPSNRSMPTTSSGRESTGASGIIISDQRIFGPTNLGLGDRESSAEQDLDVYGVRKELLAKIERCHGRVKAIEVGFCFGLLDPVSNIIVGEAIALDLTVSHRKAELEAEKWKRKVKGKKGKGEGKEMEEEEEEEEERPILRCIPERSLDGLIAFLVALFPHLTDYSATSYLNTADADPIVAALLLINHRGMESTFGFTSDTTVAAVETALYCAAAAAQHPYPRQFVLAWKLLSPSLRKVATLLKPSSAAHDLPLLTDIIRFLQLPPPPPPLTLKQSWDLANARRHDIVNLLHSPLLQPTMRRMLLTTIHGYYLQALAWLPKDKLRSHYHHSLLHAGHCHGPLDPVSNILVNTLWHAKMYPLTLEKEVEIQAISTKPLMRIAVRSLYGLISFLCTRYPDLTPADAMRRLQQAGADLRKTHDPSLADAGVETAYAAASKAARHPKPHQHAEFLAPSNLTLYSFAQVLMNREPCEVRQGFLDYFQTVAVASSISSIPAEETTKNVKVLGPWDYSRVMGNINLFWDQHNRARGMVESAIDMYSNQHGVPRYELHVICGVNESVGGPVHLTPFGRGQHFAHINFLATRTAGARPELFFAECPKVGSSKELGFCCPVAMPLPGTEQVRCPYCELKGIRIVHPAKENFRGRHREFEKMLAREGVYFQEDINDAIISASYEGSLWVEYLEEDEIYSNHSCDEKKVKGKFRDYRMH